MFLQAPCSKMWVFVISCYARQQSSRGACPPETVAGSGSLSFTLWALRAICSLTFFLIILVMHSFLHAFTAVVLSYQLLPLVALLLSSISVTFLVLFSLSFNLIFIFSPCLFSISPTFFFGARKLHYVAFPLRFCKNYCNLTMFCKSCVLEWHLAPYATPVDPPLKAIKHTKTAARLSEPSRSQGFCESVKKFRI